MSISFTLTNDHVYVAIILLSLNFFTIIIGFIFGGGARKENFHFELLDKFEKEH